MGALSMDEQHRADSRLERELRELADRLDALTLWGRIRGSTVAGECRATATLLRAEADHVVRSWN